MYSIAAASIATATRQTTHDACNNDPQTVRHVEKTTTTTTRDHLNSHDHHHIMMHGLKPSLYPYSPIETGMFTGAFSSMLANSMLANMLVNLCSSVLVGVFAPNDIADNPFCILSNCSAASSLTTEAPTPTIANDHDDDDDYDTRRLSSIIQGM